MDTLKVKRPLAQILHAVKNATHTRNTSLIVQGFMII
jgi:hypothetical protein